MIVNSWYNGYSPKERDEKYRELKRLINIGKLKEATGPCDLCCDPHVDVEYHDEDYGKPYIWTKPALLCLCRHCHRTKLHKRFKNISNWIVYLAHIRRGGYSKDLKDLIIKKELKDFELRKITSLKKLRSYKKQIGSEWFANLRMDLKSLTDLKARLR
jgi:hypothetical protein